MARKPERRGEDRQNAVAKSRASFGSSPAGRSDPTMGARDGQGGFNLTSATRSKKKGSEKRAGSHRRGGMGAVITRI